jgi:hypothetical protein
LISWRSLVSYIWGRRRGYVFLPFRVASTGTWSEGPQVSWPDGEWLARYEPAYGVDQYFCPLVFSQPRRLSQFALPTNVLWADLDTADPRQCRLVPSCAWETTPGGFSSTGQPRYQAIWFVEAELPAQSAAGLSRRIAYAEPGADRSGWDVTQILRLPGTDNHKYPAHPRINLLWAKGWTNSVAELEQAYPVVEDQLLAAGDAAWPAVDELTLAATYHSLPYGLRVALERDPMYHDRSAELQRLARLLIQFKTSPEVAVHLLQRSTFNKFAGRRDEQHRLLVEVEKAVAATRR